MQTRTYQVTEANKARVDVLLVRLMDDTSRSFIKKLIDQGMVSVNDLPVKPGYKTKVGDRIQVNLPEPVEKKIRPEKIPLDILFEDGDLIIVNKPAGMVVHPSEGCYTATLVNALLAYSDSLSRANGDLRPGIVHRLDKDTSGLLAVAKNDASHLELSRQLQERSVTRGYLCLAHGRFKGNKGMIDAPIGRNSRDRKKMAVTRHNSKEAVTHYQLLESYGDYSYLCLRLVTGRTHQIRVHLAYIKHPVVGDTKYGLSKPHLGLTRQFLHAATLGFIHPRTKEYLEFTSPLPNDLAIVLARLAGTD